ncbi:hypothetical protein NEFER03_1955 [Nematocida sp. LUAm3]|nr:hypothetical protein NEFER03_1955 [Nematocida sp. LUAm3]KAI5176039.1 hypothetical protein NEFER02_1873 [Nematocida sp. LUAm2]KAI5177073.1 hypothetical protein NEFER01_0348 [Nematocida sp. LUAm1]
MGALYLTLLIILSFIIPPLPVALEVGFTLHFWINIVLCLFFYLPGILHALYIVIVQHRKSRGSLSGHT